MLICIYCVIFITWIRVSFCVKFLKKNKKNLKKQKIKKNTGVLSNNFSTSNDLTETVNTPIQFLILTLKVLLFWIYLFLLMLIFVLQCILANLWELKCGTKKNPGLFKCQSRASAAGVIVGCFSKPFGFRSIQFLPLPICLQEITFWHGWK